MTVQDVFSMIQEEWPQWTPVYVDEFYQAILNAGFNRQTIKQAFGLAQIVEEIGPMTVRSALYQSVPMFMPDTSDKYNRATCNIILKLRRRGCISYSKIVDSTRRRLKPSSWSGLGDFLESAKASYRLDFWARQSDCLEIFVEKDAMAGALEPITREYDVNLNVIRGDASETFVWNIADEWRLIDKPIFAYYFGDHDPSGLRIERSLRDKLFDFSKGRLCPIYWVRLSVTSEDFSNPANLGFPIKGDRNSRAWQTKNGEYLERFGDRCVEIDAIHPTKLRSRLQAEIEAHIDQDEWNKLKEIESQERHSFEQFVLAQKQFTERF